MTDARALFDLGGRVAIVTGGGTGIGRQMARALAEAGADLVLCARKAERCEEAAAELAQLGVRAIGLRCDVRDPGDVEAVVARTRAELGRVDVLVNNSGTAWVAPPEELPLEGWQKVIDVNLTGVFLCAQAAGRAMIAQGDGGKIVNIASVAGLGGARADVLDAIPYNTSKAGVIGFTRDLACKWAPHGINVNAIAPGWFPSDMSSAVLEARPELVDHIPLRRFGGPDDLKGAIVFLASRASDYVTGHVLVVDGGESAW
jgi:NAD(P)-dependent dehydrogenase (short-subunit alcohol dehydrogenase family)